MQSISTVHTNTVEQKTFKHGHVTICMHSIQSEWNLKLTDSSLSSSSSLADSSVFYHFHIHLLNHVFFCAAGLICWPTVERHWHWVLSVLRSSPSTELCGCHGMSSMWWTHWSWRRWAVSLLNTRPGTDEWQAEKQTESVPVKLT